MSEALNLINKAKSQNGYREGANNNTKYGKWYPMNYQPWCAMFVSWSANEVGLMNTRIPKHASCAMGVKWYRDRGRFTEYPVIGGPVYYGPGGGTHVGLCYAYSANYIWTIEGNTCAQGATGSQANGNGVYLRKRPRKDNWVYGYGIPNFAEGTVLADPKYKGKKGYVYFGEEASTADIPKGGSSGGGSKPPAPSGHIYGVDVSSYQGSDIRSLIKGKDFCFVKVTESTTYVNPQWVKQRKQVKDAGLVFGGYHFLRPGSMEKQIDYFLNEIEVAPGDLLVLDWEDAKVTGAQKDQALKYLKSKKPKNRVGLYCNTTFWKTKDTTSYAGDFLWIAVYNGKPGSPGIEDPWVIHQYTDSPCDTNYAKFASRDAMKKWAGASSDKPNPPKPSGGSDMPKLVNKHNTAPATMATNQWCTLDFTGKGDPVVAGEGTAAAATVYVTVADTTPGCTLLGRFYYRNPDNSRTYVGSAERTATSGASYVDFHTEAKAPWDGDLRFELAVNDPKNKTVKVTNRQMRALTWN